MAEDLAGVLDTVVAAGMWLDDHYKAIRRVVERTSGTRSTSVAEPGRSRVLCRELVPEPSRN